MRGREAKLSVFALALILSKRLRHACAMHRKRTETGLVMIACLTQIIALACDFGHKTEYHSAGVNTERK